nr:sulfated surface glycoprotein 185-like [Arachis hypogaea]
MTYPRHCLPALTTLSRDPRVRVDLNTLTPFDAEPYPFRVPKPPFPSATTDQPPPPQTTSPRPCHHAALAKPPSSFLFFLPSFSPSTLPPPPPPRPIAEPSPSRHHRRHTRTTTIPQPFPPRPIPLFSPLTPFLPQARRATLPPPNLRRAATQLRHHHHLSKSNFCSSAYQVLPITDSFSR